MEISLRVATLQNVSSSPSPPPDRKDRFIGSLLAHALGDALGAPAEGKTLEPTAWKKFVLTGKQPLTWTDDTQMAIALGESLVDRGGLDPDHLARHWARSIEPWRGYGRGAKQLLTRIHHGQSWQEANRAIFPEGSYGNGAAMRIAPLALYFHESPDTLRQSATLASQITHAHPLGIEGGLLTAQATAGALLCPFNPDSFLEDLCNSTTLVEFRHRLQILRSWSTSRPELKEVRNQLGHSVRAHESVVTAIHLFLRHRNDDLPTLVSSAVELGGDVDTLAAMAGGMLGAHRGCTILPNSLLERLEERKRIQDLAVALHDCVNRPRSGHLEST
jgi:poly(ADP-ribose) glycohydrolase ARH3